MDTFSQREEGYERAFSLEEEIRFKARARRNRMLGLWAGETLGMSGTALADYASALVARGLDSADDGALVAGLVEALRPNDISEHRVRRRMEEFDAQAMAEIQAGR